MFIEKGKTYYRIGTGKAVRAVAVIGTKESRKVICARLELPGGNFEIPFKEFDAAYTLEPLIETAHPKKPTTDAKYKVSKLNKYDPRNP